MKNSGFIYRNRTSYMTKVSVKDYALCSVILKEDNLPDTIKSACEIIMGAFATNDKVHISYFDTINNWSNNAKI